MWKFHKTSKGNCHLTVPEFKKRMSVHSKPRKYFAGTDIYSAIEGKNPTVPLLLCCNGHCLLISVLKAQQWVVGKALLARALQKKKKKKI